MKNVVGTQPSRSEGWKQRKNSEEASWKQGRRWGWMTHEMIRYCTKNRASAIGIRLGTVLCVTLHYDLNRNLPQPTLPAHPPVFSIPIPIPIPKTAISETPTNRPLLIVRCSFSLQNTPARHNLCTMGCNLQASWSSTGFESPTSSHAVE